MLSVNKSVFTLPKEGKTQEAADQSNLLKVYTDYPTGWKISQIIDSGSNAPASWLTVSRESGDPDEVIM